MSGVMEGLIKGLEWVEAASGSFIAETTFGEYVVEDHGGWGMWSPSEPDGCDARSWHPTLAAARAAAEQDYRALLAAALRVDLIEALVEAGRALEAALQGDSLGDVDGARDIFDAALSVFTENPQSRPGKAHVSNVVMQAAQDAREVFEGHKRAKEAIDYMEQLLLAAFRAAATGGEVGK